VIASALITLALLCMHDEIERRPSFLEVVGILSDLAASTKQIADVEEDGIRPSATPPRGLISNRLSRPERQQQSNQGGGAAQWAPERASPRVLTAAPKATVGAVIARASQSVHSGANQAHQVDNAWNPAHFARPHNNDAADSNSSELVEAAELGEEGEEERTARGCEASSGQARNGAKLHAAQPASPQVSGRQSPSAGTPRPGQDAAAAHAEQPEVVCPLAAALLGPAPVLAPQLRPTANTKASPPRQSPVPCVIRQQRVSLKEASGHAGQFSYARPGAALQQPLGRLGGFGPRASDEAPAAVLPVGAVPATAGRPAAARLQMGLPEHSGPP
jgi:hypothetical protein